MRTSLQCVYVCVYVCVSRLVQISIFPSIPHPTPPHPCLEPPHILQCWLSVRMGFSYLYIVLFHLGLYICHIVKSGSSEAMFVHTHTHLLMLKDKHLSS